MTDELLDDDLLDDHLGAELRRLASIRRAHLVEDPVVLVQRRVAARTHTRRRRRRIGVGVLVATALGFASVVAVAVADEPTRSPTVSVPAAPSADPPEANGVEVLDPGPLSPRINTAAVTYTGGGVFVWGGNAGEADRGRQFADGATYDTKTREWSMLATSPLPASYDTPVAVGTPDGVVVARGRAVAVWHHRTNSWTRVEDAPATVRDLSWATGPVLSASANASLDVLTGHWTPLPSRPAGLEDPQVAWTGTELVVLGQGSSTEPAAAYSPDAHRWRTLPTAPNLVGNAVALAYDGNEVVAADYQQHAAAYSLASDQWRALPDLPAAFFEFYPKLVASSATVTAFTGRALVVGGSDGDWVPVPYSALGMAPRNTPGEAPAVVVELGGNSLLVFDGGSSGSNALVRIWPDRLRSEATMIGVGSASVRVGGGFRYVGGEVGRDSLSQADSVLVTFEGPGGRCVVSSSTGPRAIRARNGPWTDNGDQGRRRELVGQEVLTLKCTNPEAADAILDRIEVPGR